MGLDGLVPGEAARCRAPVSLPPPAPHQKKGMGSKPASQLPARPRGFVGVEGMRRVTVGHVAELIWGTFMSPSAGLEVQSIAGL